MFIVGTSTRSSGAVVLKRCGVAMIDFSKETTRLKQGLLTTPGTAEGRVLLGTASRYPFNNRDGVLLVF